MTILIIKIIYNNTKNASINYIFFKFNYKYYFCIFYKKDFNLNLKLKNTKKLFFKLQNLIIIY